MALEKEKGELRRFALSVKEDLGVVVENIHKINPEINKDLYRLIQEAWKEVIPRFQEISDYLEGKKELLAGAPHMDELLVQRGLVGAQLKLKLTLYWRARGEFQPAFKEFKTSSREQKKKKRGRLTAFLGKLFRVTNKTLESMSFVPGSDAVKEMKGALEDFL